MKARNSKSTTVPMRLPNEMVDAIDAFVKRNPRVSKAAQIRYLIGIGLERSKNDLVRLAMERAAERFCGTGGYDGTFNSANFSAEFAKLAGIRGPIDGHVVRAILTGRPDVCITQGEAHWRLAEMPR